MKRLFILIIIILIAVGLVGACQSEPYQFKGSVMEPPMVAPDFELAATTGKTFRLSDIGDDIALVFFGYTYCPDVCPLTMSDVKTALNNLESGQERVRVIFISVDPARDTPEKLAQYLSNFGPQFIGLSDDMSKVEPVLASFGAFAEAEAHPDSATDYLVSHTGRLYLLNGQGEISVTYPFGFSPEDLQADLAYLLQNSP